MFDFFGGDYMEAKRIRFVFGILLDSLELPDNKKQLMLDILRGDQDKEICKEWEIALKKYKEEKEKEK